MGKKILCVGSEEFYNEVRDELTGEGCFAEILKDLGFQLTYYVSQLESTTRQEPDIILLDGAKLVGTEQIMH